MLTLTEKIREELRARKQSLRKISIATGLQRITIKEFLAGKECHSSTVDKLSKYLGVEVTFQREK